MTTSDEWLYFDLPESDVAARWFAVVLLAVLALSITYLAVTA